MEQDEKVKKEEKTNRYLDTELKTSLVSAAAGAAIGYASFLINHTAGAAVLAVLVYVAFYHALKKAWKINEDRRWWLGNSAVLYFFVWLVIWTILYNTVLLA